MKSTRKKIVITGGEGRFAKSLRNSNLGLNIFYPNKKELNILNTKSIDKYLKKIKPKYQGSIKSIKTIRKDFICR